MTSCVPTFHKFRYIISISSCGFVPLEACQLQKKQLQQKNNWNRVVLIGGIFEPSVCANTSGLPTFFTMFTYFQLACSQFFYQFTSINLLYISSNFIHFVQKVQGFANREELIEYWIKVKFFTNILHHMCQRSMNTLYE